MKNWYFIFLVWVPFLFLSCQKLPEKRWDVQYKAVNVGRHASLYRMTYMTRSGGTKVVGPISTRHWESEVLMDYDEGSPVQLEIEILSGEASFDLQILRDGGLHEHLVLAKGNKYLIVTSEI